MTDTATVERRPVATVPSALDRFDDLEAAIAGRIPAIFLDYDGTLTPIVARPELAILSEDGRAVVRDMASKLPVAVVSGRDRPDVEKLVGIDELIFVGSHGFDIRTPDGGTIDNEVGGDVTPLLDGVERKLHDKLDPIEGSLVERKKFSIAAHYRLVADADYDRFRGALDQVLAETPEIKEKSGKKVFEYQPRIDWDKGKAVLWLMGALGMDDGNHIPMFFGDDVTDEDAFAALQGRGLGVIVSAPSDDATDRTTAAHFRVHDTDQLLDLLRRMTPA